MTSHLVEEDKPAAAAPRPEPTRIPLNTLAIGFGLAGLAGAWSKATPALHLPPVVTQSFWAIAAAAWVWLLVAHLIRGARSGQRLRDQLRHPVQGPFAALAPVTAMLLSADLFTISPVAGRMFFLLALAAAALLAAWLFSWWFEANLELSAMHPGYLLPTVAPGLVGADVAHVLGYPVLAWALFGVGSFFTVVMTALVVLRLAFHPALPDALLPSVAILLAPPAVAGIAWFSLNGHATDPVAYSIAGIGVLLLLIQAAVLPRYRKLSFSPGFWSFTFPLAATVSLVEQWLAFAEPSGWRVLTGVALALITGFIAIIGFRSLRTVSHRAASSSRPASATTHHNQEV